MSKKYKKSLVIAFLAFFILSSADISLAEGEDKLTLTITPPLIKINMAPGERWAGSIRVVNNNPIATSIYANKVDFKSGEDGGVVFINAGQSEDEQASFLLSQWLTVPTEAIFLAPYETKEVSLVIDVPADAEAGGHYAAVLTGTKPNDESKLEGSGIKISSMLASLIMLNVKGEIFEKGDIREFTTSRELYTEPTVDFNLRFENTGNVHLQPQGEIVIYNMFGREKGKIEINQNSQFGNVLPKSIRKWPFAWQAEKGFLASGRYRADLVLGFGEQAKQNVSQTVYFWVIDVKMTAIIVGSVLLLILLIALIIRLYVRKAVRAVERQVALAAVGTKEMAVIKDTPKAVVSVKRKEAERQEHLVDLRKK